ncbi:MAG: hypothetical protein WBB27_17640 [Maribacter sp.]
MLLRKTDIREKLNSEKSKDIALQQNAIAQVYRILAKDTEKASKIENTIASGKGKTENALNFDLLDTSRIYHIKEIKNICIDYRLRFLESKYFKGKVPVEAISKIKSMEKEHGIELKGFKIMAPSKLFKLEDKDDPLLFAPIGNEYFYLIHQWGNDLHPLRKLFMWPFKNIVNLGVLVLFISYLATLMVPSGLFSKSSSAVEFWIIYFFMFKCIASVVIFYGFALGKNFNPAIWNSKYFNA